MSRSCASCALFEPSSVTADSAAAAARIGVDRRGTCHRYPEAVRKLAEDWCGEWAPGKQAPKGAPKAAEGTPKAAEDA